MHVSMTARVGIGLVLGAGAVGTVSAGYNISVGGSAPTYASTLNFDEAGGATGSITPGDQPWSSIGLTVTSGEGARFVGNMSTNPGFNWLPNNNVLYAPFGAFFDFASPVTEFSAQYWDSSGPATFMGGGAVVALFSGDTKVSFFQITEPAYGGVGDSWVNVTTTDGSTFTRVALIGFGFFPEAYVDNLSWNAVPTPSAAGLLALAGLVGVRRRR